MPSPSISISYLSGTPCLSISHLSPEYIVFSSRVILLRLEREVLTTLSDLSMIFPSWWLDLILREPSCPI